MRFEVLGGQWDYPGKFSYFDSVTIEGDTLVVRRPADSPGASARSSMLWGLLRSLALSVVIFLVFYYVFHFIFFWLSFIPLLWQLGSGGGKRVAGHIGNANEPEVLVPLSQIRNPGGGGSTVAFGIAVPGLPREVTVLVHLEDESEAERLRFELKRGAVDS
jgi:hypothetical protein